MGFLLMPRLASNHTPPDLCLLRIIGVSTWLSINFFRFPSKIVTMKRAPWKFPFNCRASSLQTQAQGGDSVEVRALHVSCSPAHRCQHYAAYMPSGLETCGPGVGAWHPTSGALLQTGHVLLISCSSQKQTSEIGSSTGYLGHLV
jgi:hypothetical protein